VTSLADRLIDRLPEPVRHAPQKIFPRHASFLLGEIALLSFVVLVVTGIYLTWFYDASGQQVVYDGSYEPLQGVEVSRAYASVLDITFDRPFGSVIRQTHHWAALVFVAALVLHAMRVFFTGAFRRPRRANWLIGLVLMGLAMANGFFGLALPNDLLGGTGSRIGHAFAVSIPVVGPGVADLLFAGEFGNPASCTASGSCTCSSSRC
jgi:ubiquinol-cytochrome c reductase cytochrome b subunit